MSIHETIFLTLDQTDQEVMTLIGAGDIESVRSRREIMRLFLANNEWDAQKYKDFLRTSTRPVEQGEPLIGTIIAETLKRTGLDAPARWYTAMTGKDCGCSKREQKLNDFHRKLKHAAAIFRR